ncbi:bifunctional N(6)-L-threonylcarbamoyladenine synthase/serine/threonine protein kinase [Haloplanus rallus]|jgi:N6-L-threonylcarbamoyladenine synthase/protein kinase Bud32|uniref:Probable bifunctional tRNA threonylcarbamoyladenosine biosynthesis protein n=1 Tax=Haloplanus rallus TaxID=1816183 RepID=A0A6B9F4I7_9EURY|nr:MULTISPECIES: bifunctional N(6)-L-threonylcarbamoyladenine synthase/serine/threonine protein kinase [Haloplanus]QGX95385.1 bifunctional N(6)-L-threonylcarbamoyladenine synthase/serine/threonine protein kinase [Haloplanus rallus]
MRILGIEGTAWAASAAVYRFDPAAPDADADPFIETDAYQPESGGIHPREAAEHMGEAIPAVIEAALDAADGPIDAVAFSRGPGLGPCLRIVGTAARALAGTLDVPLIGVNHMVAHLEIGRHGSGFDSPVCLNASGANAHLLGYHDGRYRVLGETMDTGVGNALDKFTRHVGWSHPGGPKVEAAAADGEYVDLPYVVKGMDFSFSGLMSAAKDAYDEGTPVEDVCFSLQETIFAMLTEVAERALSLTGADELVLGGGVGQNARLREMLSTMCADRDAEFYAPEPRFLRDNAGMIAVLGAKMYAAGATVDIEDSAVDPNFRPDEVAVTWRDGESVAIDPVERPERQGAEAVVTVGDERVTKRRLPKAYRHPALDERLRRERTVAEARLTSEARRRGVPTPVVRDVDVPAATLTFDRVGDRDLAAALTPARARVVGDHLATLHDAGIVHGDPTVRNVRLDGDRVFLIDFGLGYHSGHVEDHAMDCHVFEGSVRGTATESAADAALAAFEEGYAGRGADAVLSRLRDVEGRGRYR